METLDLDGLKDEIKYWKQQSLANPHPPPLIIDIYLDISRVNFNTQYLTIRQDQNLTEGGGGSGGGTGGGGQRQRIPHDALYRNEASSVTGEFKDKIILESWQLSLT